MRDLRVGRPDESPLIIDASFHGLADDFPEWVEVNFRRAVKAGGKGCDEFLLIRGVDDGEGDFLEGAFKVLCEDPLEEGGDLAAVIPKGATTPSPEDERIVAMGLRDREDLNDAGAQEFRKLGGLLGVEVFG